MLTSADAAYVAFVEVAWQRHLRLTLLLTGDRWQAEELLQRLVNGSWSTVAGRTLSSTSTYGFTVKPSYRATYYYRVYKPADVDHLAGHSGTRSFPVY